MFLVASVIVLVIVMYAVSVWVLHSDHEKQRNDEVESHMDFTILAVVLLIGVGIPARNKWIRKFRDKEKAKDDRSSM